MECSKVFTLPLDELEDIEFQAKYFMFMLFTLSQTKIRNVT